VLVPFLIVLVDGNRSLFGPGEHTGNVLYQIHVVWCWEEREGDQWIHDEVHSSEHSAEEEGEWTHHAEQDAGAGSLQEVIMFVMDEVRCDSLHHGVTQHRVFELELDRGGVDTLDRGGVDTLDRLGCTAYPSRSVFCCGCQCCRRNSGN